MPEGILYAVFDGDFSRREIAVVETMDDATPDWQFVPPVICPAGHHSPTPRTIFLNRLELESATKVVRGYAKPSENRENQDTLDRLITSDEDQEFDALLATFERRRSLNSEAYTALLNDLETVRTGLGEIATPGSLLGPLRQLTSKSLKPSDRFAVRYGTHHHLLFTPEAWSEIEEVLRPFVTTFRDGEWVQCFVKDFLSRNLNAEVSLPTCPVCGLATEYFPKGSVVVGSGTSELFYFKGCGMLHAHGRAAERLSKLKSLALVPWGRVQ